MMDKDVFKQIRINAGLSQFEYAKELGLTQAFVSMMENGHYAISDNTRRKVAAKFETGDILTQMERLKRLS